MVLLFLFVASGCLAVALWYVWQPSSSQTVAPDQRAIRSSDEIDTKDPVHPLDPAIARALKIRKRLQTSVRDYSARLIKQERIRGTLHQPQQLLVKIRQRKTSGETEIPLSVYLRFEEPKSLRGREVIWIEGQNAGKLVAHEPPGLRNWFRVKLAPTSKLAMAGNRYPITHIGLENLVAELIHKGLRDRKLGPCEVDMTQQVKIAGRTCQRILVRHPQKKPELEFHLAIIDIDTELELPIHYAAYSWPETAGSEPQLLEEYTYTELKINIGLTDRDFDPDNPDYKFP